MIAYKINDKLNPPPLEGLHIGGSIGELMNRFFEERIFSDYARSVIYPETEEQFRLRDDDKTIVGMWRGEFWGKWMISACRAARMCGRKDMYEFLRSAAHRLIATADPDGYIGTYRDKANFLPCDREAALAVVGWRSNWNWNIWCRKYTLWGLLECYLLTSDEEILSAAAKSAVQLIDLLGKTGYRIGETGTFNGLPSGSILKPMLILYRLTGDERFLKFSIGIADNWERADGRIPNLISNALEMKPIHEWYPSSERWAKAYEMMSCLDGLLELYRVTGVERYFTAVSNLYTLLCEYEQNRLYSVGFNDIFAHAAEYPNSLSEPCDVIHWMRLCHELYRLTGDSKYIDSFELAFYNPFLAGVFSDGKWGARAVRSAGRHMVALGQADMKYSHCCVNNMPRGFVNAAETFVMLDADGRIYLNLYSEFDCETDVGRISLRGGYLTTGRVSAVFDLTRGTDVYLRIPRHCRAAYVNGEELNLTERCHRMSLPAGHSQIELNFEYDTNIEEMKSTPTRYPDNDFRIARFVTGNNVPTDVMTFDRRAVITRGPLLLVHSKLIGNSDEEIFPKDSICGQGCTCKAEPVESDAVRAMFRLRIENADGSFETTMCDYASGSNRWSQDDARLFNIYV